MAGKPWSDERKAAHGAMMRQRWAAGRFKKRSRNLSAEERAARSERAKRLNARLAGDPELRARWHRSICAARNRPDYVAMQSLVMAETMARPENREKARAHACTINRDPGTRQRQNAGRKQKKALRRLVAAIASAER